MAIDLKQTITFDPDRSHWDYVLFTKIEGRWEET